MRLSLNSNSYNFKVKNYRSHILTFIALCNCSFLLNIFHILSNVNPNNLEFICNYGNKVINPIPALGGGGLRGF